MPGAGAKFLRASSALMRHSIAWPRSSTSCVTLSGSPAAIADLLAHDVDAGDHLGHAVLDLHAGVHLQEEVLAVREQAFDRAGAAVATARAAATAISPRRSRSAGSTRGRGRLLDQLLVAALDRAVALAEVDDVAVAVGEDLDLDVARVGQVALEVDGRVGEELLALAGRALERGLQLVPGSATRKPLPPPPPAALTVTGSRSSAATARRPRRVSTARWCRARSARPRRASARARSSWSPSPRSPRRAGR